MKNTNYAAKIPFTVQLLKGKKYSCLANCYIPSFKFLHPVQILVYSCNDFGAKQKKLIWNLTLRVQFCRPRGLPGGWGRCWSFDLSGALAKQIAGSHCEPIGRFFIQKRNYIQDSFQMVSPHRIGPGKPRRGTQNIYAGWSKHSVIHNNFSS